MGGEDRKFFLVVRTKRCPPADWLADWMPGWLAGWLTCCLLGWLTGCTTDPVKRPASEDYLALGADRIAQTITGRLTDDVCAASFVLGAGRWGDVREGQWVEALSVLLTRLKQHGHPLSFPPCISCSRAPHLKSAGRRPYLNDNECLRNKSPRIINKSMGRLMPVCWYTRFEVTFKVLF